MAYAEVVFAVFLVTAASSTLRDPPQVCPRGWTLSDAVCERPDVWGFLRCGGNHGDAKLTPRQRDLTNGRVASCTYGKTFDDVTGDCLPYKAYNDEGVKQPCDHDDGGMMTDSCGDPYSTDPRTKKPRRYRHQNTASAGYCEWDTFSNGWVQKDCGPGTKFNLSQCACGYSGW